MFTFTQNPYRIILPNKRSTSIHRLTWAIQYFFKKNLKVKGVDGEMDMFNKDVWSENHEAPEIFQERLSRRPFLRNFYRNSIYSQFRVRKTDLGVFPWKIESIESTLRFC